MKSTEGVRKGTRVLTPLDPPVNGGKNTADVSGRNNTAQIDRGKSTESVPSPLTGRAREGFFRPIETLFPGDLVFGHDGLPNRVVRVILGQYCGAMVGINTNRCKNPLWVTSDHCVLCAKRTSSYGGNRSWGHVPGGHFERARQMRNEMTGAERTLWRSLKGNQLAVKFRRQHLIGPYIADFYSREAGLVIEVDGDSHFTAESVIYDQERTKYLEALGLTIIRFTNAEIRQSFPQVLDEISRASSAVKPSEEHYKEWRRADSLREGDIVFTAEAFAPPRSPRQRGEEYPRTQQGKRHDLGYSRAVHGEDQREVRVRLKPIKIESLEKADTSEAVYDLEVENCHSFVTEVCVVHNCGRAAPQFK